MIKWFGSYEFGIWSIRFGKFLIGIKAPWNRQLFSERNGYGFYFPRRPNHWRIFIRRRKCPSKPY